MVTGAPFPLGSSVSYWLWAGNGQYGLHRSTDPAPGCIAVMGKDGNPADGSGPNGHTGIVVNVAGGTVTCIESRGHVGVCLKTRPRSFWNGFITVVGMNRPILAALYVWEAMFDAVTGTVERVPYYSGPGDNDHDGWPDRADIGDGNGIDCSGCVKLCMDYGYQHDRAQPVPAPTPPQWEDDEMRSVDYLGAWSTYLVGDNGRIYQVQSAFPGMAHDLNAAASVADDTTFDRAEPLTAFVDGFDVVVRGRIGDGPMIGQCGEVRYLGGQHRWVSAHYTG